MTKQQWRTVVISMAAVAFSATAGLEPPLRNLINFARAGASYSAKQLCSSVLMAGMDPEQVLQGRPGRRPGDDPHPDQTKRWTR